MPHFFIGSISSCGQSSAGGTTPVSHLPSRSSSPGTGPGLSTEHSSICSWRYDVMPLFFFQMFFFFFLPFSSGLGNILNFRINSISMNEIFFFRYFCSWELEFNLPHSRGSLIGIWIGMTGEFTELKNIEILTWVEIIEWISVLYFIYIKHVEWCWIRIKYLRGPCKREKNTEY